MSAPRNVTPGLEEKRPRDPDSPPEWLDWSWATRGRSFPWLGILLVMIGAGLLIEYFVPAIGIATLFLGALAAFFAYGWLVGRASFAAVPALLIGALAVARLLEELGIYNGPGTTSFALAVAFVLIWLIGARRRRRSTWPIWGAVVFGGLGVIAVSGRLVDLPQLNLFWPVVIVVVGFLLLAGSGRRR